MMDRLRLWWAAKRAEWDALERRRNEVEEYIANLSEGRDPDSDGDEDWIYGGWK